MDFRRKRIPLHSLTLELDDAKRIFERLDQRVKTHGQQVVAAMATPNDLTEEQWADKKADILAKAFRVTVSLIGHDEEVLFGDNADVFTSPNRPDTIKRIYLTNVTAFQSYTDGRRPDDTFELLLDFSKPHIPDAGHVLTSPTENDSNLHIATPNDTWLAAIQEAVVGVLDRRKNNRNFVHRAFVYDAGLLLVGLPFALYMCWKLSGIVNNAFGGNAYILNAASYAYIVLLSLWAYRLLFEYTRWAFPSVELKNKNAGASIHRSFWFTIMVGLTINGLYDVFF